MLRDPMPRAWVYSMLRRLEAEESAILLRGDERDHAELVESNRQNEYAARLWKAHAEAALTLTDEELSRLISGIHVLVRQHTHMADKVTADLLLKLLKAQAGRL